MERVMGIEPTSSAWKAEVLPLNYTRLRETGTRKRECRAQHAASGHDLFAPNTPRNLYAVPSV